MVVVVTTLRHLIFSNWELYYKNFNMPVLCFSLQKKIRVSSHSCEKRLIAFSCLSVRLSDHPSVSPNVSARLPLDRCPWNFILGDFMKLCHINPNLITIRQKYRTLYMKTELCFIVVSDTNSPRIFFTLLIVTCTSTTTPTPHTHTERVVACPTSRQSQERASILGYQIIMNILNRLNSLIKIWYYFESRS